MPVKSLWGPQASYQQGYLSQIVFICPVWVNREHKLKVPTYVEDQWEGCKSSLLLLSSYEIECKHKIAINYSSFSGLFILFQLCPLSPFYFIYKNAYLSRDILDKKVNAEEWYFFVLQNANLSYFKTCFYFFKFRNGKKPDGYKGRSHVPGCLSMLYIS